MESGTSVFTVFSGSYSDRGMIGVFSTRELAQEYIDREKACGNREIDDEPGEETLDEVKPRNMACVLLERGEPKIYDTGWSPIEDEGFVRKYGYLDDNPGYIVSVNFNPDFDVMVKSARDRLAQWKALNAGI